MQRLSRFCICFSGIVIRFRLPSPTTIPKALSAFLCDDPGRADADFEVCLISEPLPIEGNPVHVEGSMELYRTREGWLRVYSPLIAEDGCQVACLLRPDGKNKLYYPASRWAFYSSSLHCIHLIGGETLLLKQNAFLLHSSVVLFNGKVVLFSGPSGAGKSTQASLWEQHLGATVVNGDRCVIRKLSDGFYGGGSPWSGTSGIYRPEQAPIAGIFLVHQAPENSVQRLGRAAFPALFGQTIVNSWDSAFMEKITELFSEMMAQVPIYRLNCRPDEGAVKAAYHTLF